MNITYDIPCGDVPPEPGQYVVSVSKRGIGSVYLVQSIRPVKQKEVRNVDRYAIVAQSMPEMKPYTVWDEENYEMWVRGESAHYLVWYPRQAKQVF